MARESADTVVVNVHAPVERTIERQEGIMTGVRRILICFFGVFFSYLVYGLTQEKMLVSLALCYKLLVAGSR